jgi:hypothetical protein
MKNCRYLRVSGRENPDIARKITISKVRDRRWWKIASRQPPCSIRSEMRRREQEKRRGSKHARVGGRSAFRVDR